MRPVLTSLRPQQWVKNILVASAPAAAGVLDQQRALGRTLAGIVIFSLAASAVYLFNDLADVDVDRQHPQKRNRPIASGQVPESAARAMALGLGVLSLVAATAINVGFGIIIAVYLAVNLSYSSGLKRVPYVELFAVASGFFLRAIAGGTLTDVPLSVWFLVVVSAGSLLVVAGKRMAEFLRVGASTSGRPVLQRYTNSSLTAVRGAAGGTAIVAYGLWAASQETASSPWDLLSLIPFALAIVAYDQAVQQGRGEDPEQILRHDRLFQLLLVAWLVIYGLGVYL